MEWGASAISPFGTTDQRWQRIGPKVLTGYCRSSLPNLPAGWGRRWCSHELVGGNPDGERWPVVGCGRQHAAHDLALAAHHAGAFMPQDFWQCPNEFNPGVERVRLLCREEKSGPANVSHAAFFPFLGTVPAISERERQHKARSAWLALLEGFPLFHVPPFVVRDPCKLNGAASAFSADATIGRTWWKR